MDIPKELLSKEFLSQFRSQDDVSHFMKDLHARVYEELLEREMDFHLGYQKHSVVLRTKHTLMFYSSKI